MCASITGKVFDLLPHVEAMIRFGYHAASGMSEAEYRALWPKSVIQPSMYRGRFDQALLVDRTIDSAKLVACGKIVEYVKFTDCTDLVLPPKGSDGKPLSCYVAFIQDGMRNQRRSVEECQALFEEDEVGLVTIEGLHLPVHIFQHYGVDIPGSRFDAFHAPSLGWFAHDLLRLDARVVQARCLNAGSASRGSQVIPLS